MPNRWDFPWEFPPASLSHITAVYAFTCVQLLMRHYFFMICR